jgi:hypothetical protein
MRIYLGAIVSTLCKDCSRFKDVGGAVAVVAPLSYGWGSSVCRNGERKARHMVGSCVDGQLQALEKCTFSSLADCVRSDDMCGNKMVEFREWSPVLTELVELHITHYTI